MGVNKALKYIWSSNFAITIFLTIIVGMAIFPLPGWMIDSLIAISIISTFLLFATSLYIKSVVELESLPTMLLFMTFFRLSLSIATTRQILSGGDTGTIIVTFGEVVIGGNVVVGLVVFFVITIVQFLVIAKGSERVAEVAARFTLDAIPGKQMSIDAELRNASITSEEAKVLRLKLEVESKFYGSMDGALKFVKGDSIAGMIIVFVNLLGGLATGIMLHGLSAGESFNLYAILTIGDGLTGQIPAIFTSLACGVIISRVDASNTSSQAIQSQLLSNTSALQLGVLFCLVFALIPGFPAIQFCLIASLLVLVIYKRHQNAGISESSVGINSNTKMYEGSANHVATISIFKGADSNILNMNKIEECAEKIRQISNEMHVPYMSIEVNNSETTKKLISVRISSVIILPVIVRDVGSDIVKIIKSDTDEIGWRSLVEIAVNNSSYSQYVYVSSENIDALESFGVRYIKMESVTDLILDIILTTYKNRCSGLIGIEETLLINRHMLSYDKEQAEAVNSKFSMRLLNRVIQDHLDSGLSLRIIDDIYSSLTMESIADGDNEIEVIEKYRYIMRQSILSEHSSGTMVFALIPVSNVLIEYTNKATQLNAHGDTIFNINREVFDFLKRCILAYLDNLDVDDYPLMVVVGDTRIRFRNLLARMGIYTPIITADELVPGMADMVKQELCAFSDRPDIQELITNNGAKSG